MSKRLSLTVGTILLMSALLIFKCLSDTSFTTIVIATLAGYFTVRGYTDVRNKEKKLLDEV